MASSLLLSLLLLAIACWETAGATISMPKSESVAFSSDAGAAWYQVEYGDHQTSCRLFHQNAIKHQFVKGEGSEATHSSSMFKTKKEWTVSWSRSEPLSLYRTEISLTKKKSIIKLHTKSHAEKKKKRTIMRRPLFRTGRVLQSATLITICVDAAVGVIFTRTNMVNGIYTVDIYLRDASAIEKLLPRTHERSHPEEKALDLTSELARQEIDELIADGFLPAMSSIWCHLAPLGSFVGPTALSRIPNSPLS